MSAQADEKNCKASRQISRDRQLERINIWWSTIGPLLAVLAVFLLTVFDPFDFESVTKRQSARIFYKIYGANYPTGMRDNIAVVLLDDETLKKRNEPWPPSHLVHGDVLSAILSFEPAAVLVDIFFVHAREKDNFEYTENVIRSAKSPIFLVAAGASTKAPRWARDEILQLREEKKLTLVSAEIEGDAQETPLYPLHDDSSQFTPAALAGLR